MKRIVSLVLALGLVCVCLAPSARAAAPEGLDVAAPSALLMEKSTGTVLWEKDAPPGPPPRRGWMWPPPAPC